MPEKEWKHIVRVRGPWDGIGCSTPGEAEKSVRHAFNEKKVTLKTEPWGKADGGSVVLLKRVGGEELDETPVGLFKVEHPGDIIKRVLLHTDSEELIRELEQKGFSVEECG